MASASIRPGCRRHRSPASEAADPAHWLRKVILFLSGQTISLFGSMLVQYAVFWYLTITYQSGVVMMLAALFGFLPQAVISIFGGVWADRHNRKLLIMGADAAIALHHARAGDHHDDGLRRGVADLPHDGASLGRAPASRCPRCRRSIPQITPTRNLHARQRHQRLDPVRDGAPRACGSRRPLRVGVCRRRAAARHPSSRSSSSTW